MILRDSTSIFCVLVCLIAPSARAENSALTKDNFVALSELAEETRLLGCKNEGMAAAIIMLARQMGQSAKQIKKTVPATGKLDFDAVIEAAFKTPKSTTRSSQTRESDRFKTRYTVACLNR